MMGSIDRPQDELFYAFNLDDVVPQDHLLRDIDRIFDLSELRAHLAPYYSHTGRPSVDPELMIRMLLIGYCLGIRSERQLVVSGCHFFRCPLSLPLRVADGRSVTPERGHKIARAILRTHFGVG